MAIRKPGHQVRREPPRGQHFLKKHQLAEEIVETAEISAADLVVEVGAGKGRFTGPLCTRAQLVLAVEKNHKMATLLIDRFREANNVIVVTGDVTEYPLPADPYRVFGNIPFGITTQLLRRLLDDPQTTLVRTDLIVQLGAALKRARPKKSNLLNMSWGPWWEFEMGMRLHRNDFNPPPSVETAVLTIKRRASPLLPPNSYSQYQSFVASAYQGNQPLHASLPRRVFERAVDAEVLSHSALATDLSVSQWIMIFHLACNQASGVTD